jgi:hypothetical protein
MVGECVSAPPVDRGIWNVDRVACWFEYEGCVVSGASIASIERGRLTKADYMRPRRLQVRKPTRETDGGGFDVGGIGDVVVNQLQFLLSKTF